VARRIGRTGGRRWLLGVDRRACRRRGRVASGARGDASFGLGCAGGGSRLHGRGEKRHGERHGRGGGPGYAGAAARPFPSCYWDVGNHGIRGPALPRAVERHRASHRGVGADRRGCLRAPAENPGDAPAVCAGMAGTGGGGAVPGRSPSGMGAFLGGNRGRRAGGGPGAMGSGLPPRARMAAALGAGRCRRSRWSTE